MRRAARWCAVQLSRRQPVATPMTMAVVTGGLLLVCSAVGVVGTVLRGDSPQQRTILVLMVLSAVTGAGVLALRHHLRTWHYHLLYLGGLAVIITCSHLNLATSASAAVADAAMMMILAACALFFFFPATTGVAHLVVGLGCSSVAFLSGGLAAADLVVLDSTSLMVAFLVWHLSRATRTAERAASPLLARGRPGDPLTLVMLDLDHFKAVNDTLGHAAGDDLLRATGRSWAPLLPVGALLGRWGGDAFVLLAPCTPAVAVRLVAAMRAALPAGRSTTAGLCTVHEGVPLQAAMRRADDALYAAKRSRRGTTAVWDGTAPPAADGCEPAARPAPAPAVTAPPATHRRAAPSA